MLELLLVLTLLGPAQTIPPTNTDYTKVEMRDVSQFRQPRAFSDPYSGIVAAPVPTIDTSSQRVAVSYQTSDAINRLVAKMIDYNLTRTTAPGYRIQLFSGARDAASSVKYEAMSLFPDQAVYSPYERPYFKVRIGDFISQGAANRMLRTVRETYPGAFVVPEEVNLKK